VLGERSQFRYDCDGDNWQHVLLVEKTFPPEEGVQALRRC